MPGSDPLILAAREARLRAWAPYSSFLVGAAVEGDDGRIVVGCNVENASYGLTVCAERVALFKAVSDGIRGFRRLVVVTDTPDPTAPCGACRQVIWELCGDIPITLANLEGRIVECTTAGLLPRPFDRRSLER